MAVVKDQDQVPNPAGTDFVEPVQFWEAARRGLYEMVCTSTPV